MFLLDSQNQSEDIGAQLVHCVDSLVQIGSLANKPPRPASRLQVEGFPGRLTSRAARCIAAGAREIDRRSK